MAADTDRYRKMLADLKKKSKGGGDKNYMELEDGQNPVRFCPGHPSMDAFYVEVHKHSKKGPNGKQMSVVCLNNGDPRGSDCLICEELLPFSASKDKADKDRWSSQRAKPRYYSNILDRADENKLKILEYGTQIMQGFLSYLCDPDYGAETDHNLLSLTKGFDVTITKTGKDMKTTYEVKAKRDPSLLLPTKEEIINLIQPKNPDQTKLYDLTDFAKQFEGEAVKAYLVWTEGWDALKDLDETAETPAPKPASPKKPAVTANAGSAKKPAVDITSYPRLTSSCSVCGNRRHQTPSGNVCSNGHVGVPPLAKGEHPTNPSAEYLKAHPELITEEVEELATDDELLEGEDVSLTGDLDLSFESASETPAPPAKATPAKTAKPTSQPAPATKKAVAADDGLDDLDQILREHQSKTGGKK